MGLKELVLLRIARRWISGVGLESAIEDTKKANSREMGAVVNFLGEEITDLATADSHTGEYLRLQQAMADGRVTGHPSVKLTQLGLLLGQDAASVRLERIAANSERLGQRLWLDMEGSSFTDQTLSIYSSAHKSHQRLGVALQAYMRRSESDLKVLLNSGGKVRLVKGAYRENADVVFRGRDQIRNSYVRLMEMLFDRGDGFAIGTHDSVLVERAQKLADAKHVAFEFEMLKGIRDELKLDLVKSGYRVSVYLPYGDRWYAYSKRRLTEHPSNVWLLLRSLV